MKAAAHDGPLDLGALHAASPHATPFTHPAWSRAWWRYFAGSATPLTIAVHDGADLVGAAELALTRRGPLRVLTMVGIEPGDYWDVLARPDHRAEACRAVGAEIRRQARRWDACLLKLLPPDSPLPGALPLRVAPRPAIPSPAITLGGDFAAYLKTLPSSRRQNLKRHLKRLDSGEVTLHERADATEALERWQGFRERQWEAAGKTINPEHLSGHFKAFIADVCAAGVGRVWEFEHDGRIVGTYVNVSDDAAFYWYLGGFDPAVTSLGLGKIAIGAGIRESAERGRERYDFTRGDEAYKYWYGAQDRYLPALVAGHDGLVSRAVLAGARAAIRRRDA